MTRIEANFAQQTPATHVLSNRKAYVIKSLWPIMGVGCHIATRNTRIDLYKGGNLYIRITSQIDCVYYDMYTCKCERIQKFWISYYIT